MYQAGYVTYLLSACRGSRRMVWSWQHEREAMTDLEAVKADRVKGKDVHGKVMTLVRTQPKQLSLFQTFLPENDDKYSNTIELYDAVPKYFPTRHMNDKRESGKYLPIGRVLDLHFHHHVCHTGILV
jgi:hypothetical protein